MPMVDIHGPFARVNMPLSAYLAATCDKQSFTTLSSSSLGRTDFDIIYPKWPQSRSPQTPTLFVFAFVPITELTYVLSIPQTRLEPELPQLPSTAISTLAQVEIDP